MECPECHGEGRIVLFTSAPPCEACGGTGEVGYSENNTGGDIYRTLDPLSIETMADLMSIIEEEGEEVVAFVLSPHALSDVRKFDSPKMCWEGREVFLFGVPFYAASKLSPGTVVAVGTEGNLAFAEIMR